MVRKIRWVLETGFVGCTHEDEFEVLDDATDEEIDEIANEAAFSELDFSWYEVLD